MQVASTNAIPTNYGVQTSLQSFLNAPGVDYLAAYDEISRKFGQLPGTGEYITNVSLGDVCTNPSYGVSSHVVGGQHYLDIPSMPLIPEYVVDNDGFLSGTGEVCGSDPELGEVLLDFSVMAPLPDGQQRAGAIAQGPYDLLGIAPGAQYRLVVPGQAPSVSALVATFVAAANQTPSPNVITASIGWGLDPYGFPSRYLEEDPLLHSVLSTMVNAQNIIVCVSSGDGLRMYTDAPVGTAGGSAPTNLVTDPSQVTHLKDISYSSAPSTVTDTGVIDVGATTADDILAANPQDPQNAQYANQLAWPEVRWDGATGFSSGFGSRVNISAPGDAIASFFLTGAGYNKVGLANNGGTSASAPEVAAAAAVMLQVARLTGHPFSKATDVRDFLVSTAVPVPNVPQADVNVNVGPQLNVRRGVEKLLANANQSLSPGISRMAVAQRRLYSGTALCTGGNDSYQDNEGETFEEATDPTYIALNDLDDCGQQANKSLNSPITFAPDWESIPSGATYKLYVSGHPDHVLSKSAWARLWPKQIFAAANLAATSPTQRTVSLTYDATVGFHLAASVSFDVTFGPTPSTSLLVPAPVVAPVTNGSTMTVSYDFSNFPASQLNNPVLEVSYPGRMSPDSAPYFYPLWVSPVLTSPKGTIAVPVSALRGAGVYGVALNLYQQPPIFVDHQKFSLFGFTRVVAQTSARPAAPLLSLPGDSAAGIAPGHNVGLPGHGSFIVSYNVSNVPGATNAMLEISSPGPTLDGNQNTFNNPDGSVTDANGVDTGSVAMIPLPSTAGTITLTDAQAHLIPGMTHVVRVVPQMGSVGVGEASDVSSVYMNAITAPDGNSLANGWSINTTGDDGVFTTQGPITSSQITGSLIGSFSQSSGATSITGLVTQGAPYSLVGGYVGGDTVVYQSGATKISPASLNSVQVTTGANFVQGYYPPVPIGWTMLEGGTNNSTQTSAILCSQFDGFNWNLGVFTANVQTQTSTAFIQLSPPSIAAAGNVMIDANIDYDPTSNTGYVLMASTSPFGFGATDEVLAKINFGTAGITYYDLGDIGAIQDFVIDPATHIGFASALGLNTPGQYLEYIDLNAGTISHAVPVAQTATFDIALPITKLAVDPVHKLVAVQNPLPAADDTDNNFLSEVDFYDESGNYVSTTGRRYNLATWTLSDHWFALNSTTRTGFMFDPTMTQIIPFPY